MDIKIFRIGDTPIPQYKTEDSAGCDLQARLKGIDIAIDGLYMYNCTDNTHSEGESSIILHPGGQCIIPTGIEIELPKGYVGFVVPRSGLAKNFGITIVNAPGASDADYRGEIHVELWNTRNEDVVINHLDRIGQLIIVPYIKANFITIASESEFSVTDRGKNGLGSTGIC